MRLRRLAVDVVLASILVMGLGGCMKPVLVFGTATKFGLDASQRPDQTVEIAMGYDRYELASIPARNQQDGDKYTIIDATKSQEDDTYSVLGVFSLSYGNPFSTQPLVLRQFFATGWAARNAAAIPGFQTFFGHKTGEIIREGETKLRQNRAVTP